MLLDPSKILPSNYLSTNTSGKDNNKIPKWMKRASILSPLGLYVAGQVWIKILNQGIQYPSKSKHEEPGIQII